MFGVSGVERVSSYGLPCLKISERPALIGEVLSLLLVLVSPLASMQPSNQVEAGYDNPEKSNLFFKLHQLQTGSWGASSIGRITQVYTTLNSIHSKQYCSVLLFQGIYSSCMYLMLVLRY